MLTLSLVVPAGVVPVGVASAAPPTAGTFHGLNPARLLDTRVGATTIDGLFQGTGTVGPTSTTTLTIAGRGGVPTGTTAGAVALNVTAAAPDSVSYVTVWPTGATKPTASNLNLQPGTTTPNMVIVPLGTDGKINLYNDAGTTHLLVDVLGWFPTAANPATTTRVSVATGGTQADDGAYEPAISADGRYIVWESGATNLVAGDTNTSVDVFLHDRIAGTTTPVSVSSTGAQASGGPSYSPTISADARYISFYSYTTDLVTGDTNAHADVFLHDRTTGATTRINVNAAGEQSTPGESYVPAISADGRYVAYYSDGSNLVTGDTNSRLDVFVYDQGTI